MPISTAPNDPPPLNDNWFKALVNAENDDRT